MSALTHILAIFMQLLSTALNFIGMTMQKKAANNLPEIGSEVGLLKSMKIFASNKVWLFGYFLNVVSAFLNAAALAFAPISLIQPLYGFGLIILVIFSHFYLEEKITRIDIIGVLLGIAGITIIGVIAKPQVAIPHDKLIAMYVDIPAIIFLGSFLAAALISYIVSERISPKVSIIFLVFSSSIWTATAFLFSKGISTVIRDLGIVEAFFGQGWIYIYIFFALFLFVSIIGLFLLNIAYQKGQSVIVIPIWTSVILILPVLSGIIIFNEWASSSPTEIIVQAIGILVMLSAIIILSISNGRKEDEMKRKQLEQKKMLVAEKSPLSVEK